VAVSRYRRIGQAIYREGQAVKLLICVINGDDANPLTDALVREGHRATIISTTGGFLREGNATLLIGVPDDSVHAVLEIIGANCRARVRYVSPRSPAAEGEPPHSPVPTEVRVGGAVVFIADMEGFERY
jgi:uncharacterized protein YaaQ